MQKIGLKKSSHKQTYSNMIGDTAVVEGNGLRKGETGEATWSGTRMRAQLSDHAPVDALPPGTKVTIIEVTGVTLIVRPQDR